MANLALTGSSSIALSGSVVLRRNTDAFATSSAATSSDASYARVVDQTGASIQATDSTAVYLRYVDQTGASGAVTDASALAHVLVSAIGASELITHSTAFYDGLELDVWTLNVGTSAVGRYTEFNHNGVAYVNGKTFVTNDDGIFELTGTTDDGQNQKVYAETGLEQPGEFISYPRYAYVVGEIPESVAQAALGMTFYISDDDGERYDYPMQASTGARKISRVQFGRGLRVRFIQYAMAGEVNEELHITAIDTIYDATQRNLG